MEWPTARAGYWRRTGALAIDALAVTVPYAILAAVMFSLTAGAIQLNDPGIQWSRCDTVTSLPTSLDPPPLPGSNEASLCKIYSLAGQIGQLLTVNRVTKTNNSVFSVGQTYPVQTSGQIGGRNLSGFYLPSLLLLLVLSEWRKGQTPGMRLLRIRLVSVCRLDQRPVPLVRVIARHLIAVGVYIPPLILFFVLARHAANTSEPAPGLTGALLFNAFVWIAWSLWNMARVIRRFPTVYDQLLSLEVIRVMPQRPVQSAVFPVDRPPVRA